MADPKDGYASDGEVAQLSEGEDGQPEEMEPLWEGMTRDQYEVRCVTVFTFRRELLTQSTSNAITCRV